MDQSLWKPRISYCMEYCHSIPDQVHYFGPKEDSKIWGWRE